MTDDETCDLYDEFVDACDAHYEDTTVSRDDCDFYFLERVTDWLDDNNITWVDWYDLVGDFTTAAEFSGINAEAFLCTIPEQVIVVFDDYPSCETIYFKSEALMDQFTASCNDQQVQDQYKKPPPYPLTTEGPCWRLNEKYFEVRPKGGEWIFIKLASYQDFCDRVQPLLGEGCDQLYPIAGYVDLQANAYDSRFAGIAPLREHIMVGPFKSVSDAVHFKLALPAPLPT